MGTLHAQSGGSQEIFSFEYDPEWLEREQAFAFDPDLQLLRGAQYPARSRNNFGIFLDSSPDRWGRLLMQRRENLRARQEGRKPRRLTAWDYLLGVHDETRLGALRFRSPEGGEFLDGDRHLAAPPITSVGELQAASRGFERLIDEEDNPDYARWLNQLMAPGSSLGGARPKASVRDERGRALYRKISQPYGYQGYGCMGDVGASTGREVRHSAAKGEVARQGRARPLDLSGEPV